MALKVAVLEAFCAADCRIEPLRTTSHAYSIAHPTLYGWGMVKCKGPLGNQRWQERFLGAYIPGTPPVVRLNVETPLDIVAAHEQGHVDLCSNSTLGRYLIALATKAKQSADTAPHLMALLEHAAQNCWMTQEGYATIKQLCFAQTTRGADFANTMRSTLPPSYRRAAEQLRLRGSIFKPGSIPSDRQEKERLESLASETVAYMVCHAALSIPIFSLLADTETLPTVQVTAAIRQHSPDIRLKKLLTQISPELFGRFIVSATDPSKFNASMALFGAQLCRNVDLVYEVADRIKIETLLAKFDYHGKITVDYRETPADGTTNVVGMVAGTSRKKHYATPRQAKEIVDELVDKTAASTRPTIVCDLTVNVDKQSPAPLINIFFTCAESKEIFGGTTTYIDPEFAIFDAASTHHADLLLLSILQRLPPADPCNVLSMFVANSSAEQLYDLPSKLSASEWIWLVSKEFSHSWNLNKLAAKGKVYVFFLYGDFPLATDARVYAVRAAGIDTWYVGNADEAAALSGRVGLQPEGGMPVITVSSVPEHARLRVFRDPEYDDRNVECVNLTVGGGPNGHEGGPYVYGCVAGALMSGLASDFVTKDRGLSLERLM